MAFDFQKHYAPDIEQLLRQYYQSLSEKDRRRFAAVEALTLGHGGTTYIAHILGCDPHTIQEGIRELKQLPDDPAGKRVRKPGGGRKKTEAKHPALLQHVQDTIKERIAGAPMRDDVLGTDLTPKRFPTACTPTASVLAPTLSDACSIRSGWPVARSPKSCRVVTLRSATRSFAIWAISSKSFSRRGTRF